MQKQLEDFGLGEKEAKVYIASLALGRATADQLAKQAGIKRPTAYVQIESLTKMGLMSTFEEGKKTYFVPESPEGLQRLLARKKEEVISREKELTNLLPELLKNFEGAGERPLVRFFEGKEGVMSMREEILKSKRKELMVFTSQDALEAFLSGEERDAFSKRRKENQIKLKAIYTRKEGPFSEILNPMSEMRFVSPERLPLKTDIVIFEKDKVALTALEGRIFGTIIESEVITASMESLFNFIWESAKK